MISMSLSPEVSAVTARGRRKRLPHQSNSRNIRIRINQLQSQVSRRASRILFIDSLSYHRISRILSSFECLTSASVNGFRATSTLTTTHRCEEDPKGCEQLQPCKSTNCEGDAERAALRDNYTLPSAEVLEIEPFIHHILQRELVKKREAASSSSKPISTAENGEAGEKEPERKRRKATQVTS